MPNPEWACGKESAMSKQLTGNVQSISASSPQITFDIMPPFWQTVGDAGQGAAGSARTRSEG